MPTVAHVVNVAELLNALARDLAQLGPVLVQRILVVLEFLGPLFGIAVFLAVERLIPAKPANERRTMKPKMFKANVMTKKLADTLAKETALRAKKSEGGIAARRGQTKGEKK